MRLTSRGLSALVLLPCAALLTPARAATSQHVLRPGAKPVTWSGTLDFPDPAGCGDVTSRGCDTTTLVVDAPAGRWVTISVDDDYAYLRVVHEGSTVANAGQHQSVSPGMDPEPSVTFQQLRTGRVGYEVGVSDQAVTEVNKVTYHATAQLAGAAFDREGDCGVTPGLAVDEVSSDRPLRLSVRLVSTAADAAQTRRAGKGVAEIYRAIGIDARVTYDTVRVPKDELDQHKLIDVVRRKYGGMRPRGVDVVHLLTDNFAGGGFALCIGGVAYPEKAFSVGGFHYQAGGAVPVDTVEAAVIAAHEIGHLLGAQHQQSNCAEAAPAGACTVMFPAAAGTSRTFSTLERNTVRGLTQTYARG
jgi:hypothetical protein